MKFLQLLFCYGQVPGLVHDAAEPKQGFPYSNSWVLNLRMYRENRIPEVLASNLCPILLPQTNEQAA